MSKKLSERCVIPCCKLQCGITQPILRLFLTHLHSSARSLANFLIKRVRQKDFPRFREWSGEIFFRSAVMLGNPWNFFRQFLQILWSAKLSMRSCVNSPSWPEGTNRRDSRNLSHINMQYRYLGRKCGFSPDKFEVCAVVLDGLALSAFLDLHPRRLHHRRLGALPLTVPGHPAPGLHVTHSTLKINILIRIYNHNIGGKVSHISK